MLRDRCSGYCLIPLIISRIVQTKEEEKDTRQVIQSVFFDLVMAIVEHINQDEMSLARRSSSSKICRSDYTMNISIIEILATRCERVFISCEVLQRDLLKRNISHWTSRIKFRTSKRRGERRENIFFFSFSRSTSAMYPSVLFVFVLAFCSRSSSRIASWTFQM